jgi:hypothetical protein
MKENRASMLGRPARCISALKAHAAASIQATGDVPIRINRVNIALIIGRRRIARDSSLPDGVRPEGCINGSRTGAGI